MPRFRMVFCCVAIFMLFSNAIAGTETIVYQYDDSGQLTTTDYGTTSVLYLYDTVGNRIAKTVYPSGDIQNNPPNTPSLVFPSNGATDVDTRPELAWSGSDPDSNNMLTYAIYFGEENQLELVRSGIYATTFTTKPLKPRTTYYWKVEARDNFNATTTSPIYSFETGDQPPNIPGHEFPAADSRVSFGSVNLRWSCQDPDIIDSLKYDIYFGTSSNPPLARLLPIIGGLSPRIYMAAPQPALFGRLKRFPTHRPFCRKSLMMPILFSQKQMVPLSFRGISP
jgi:hypothetical protein